MSSGTSPAVPVPDVIRIDDDDPFAIEVIAPIESETVDEAVRQAQAAAEVAIATAIETRLAVDANLSDVADKDAALDTLSGADRRFLTQAGPPSTTQVANGTFRVVKDSATGRLTIWANDGGTLIDLLTL